MEIADGQDPEDGLEIIKVGESIARVPRSALRKTVKVIPRHEQAARHAEIKRCAKIGFTVKQICRFSEGWRHPLRDPATMRRKLKRLRVRAKRWQEHHERSLIDSFISLCEEMRKGGWTLGSYAKEQPLGFGIPARCDMEMRFMKGNEERLRFLERQRGSLDRRRLAGKLLSYRKLYEAGILFRVLFVVETKAELQKCVDVVNDVLRDRPSLELCLMSVDGSGAWLNRWKDERRVD